MSEEKKVGRPKGTPKTGGRAPGTPNKVTQEFRQTVQMLLDDNRANVAVWLEQVAQADPAKALDLISKLAEYAAPKLARTELVGDEKAPIKHVIAWDE